jgi:LysR family transcriptional regulator for metE and metH
MIGGAGAVLARLVELEQHARTQAAGHVQLRVVCECYTAYRWLPSTLAKLGATMTNLDVSVSFEHTAAPVSALLAGDVDVALLTTSKITGSLIEQPLFTDEIVFVVAPSHPVASRPAIGPDELRAYPLITATGTPEPETRWFHRRVFGNRPARVEHLRFPLTDAIIDAARAGLGIAVLSEWIALPYLAHGDVVARRHRGRRLHRPWRIAFRPQVAGPAQQLAAALAGAPPRLFR